MVHKIPTKCFIDTRHFTEIYVNNYARLHQRVCCLMMALWKPKYVVTFKEKHKICARKWKFYFSTVTAFNFTKRVTNVYFGKHLATQSET
jgi:hypothetical protein